MSNSIPPPTGAVYRTPSLAFVDRWINVSGVLEGSVGVHAASAALAFIFQNEDIQCSPGSSGSVFVAYVDEGSRELAQGVAASLAGQFLQFPLPGGLESYSQTHSLTLNPDSRVVIVADIIHSANTAKRAIEEIRALGGIPLATLTVIDARPLQTDRILDVPVLSLCEQQVSVPQPEDSSRVINIDALLHSPTRDEQARSAILSYPISEAELLERCKEERAEGSLCFSHMQSELGRHFFAFPDALRLFDDDFINKACLTAETWLNMAVTKTNGPIEFWIPGLLSDDASELAPSIIAGVKELIPSATFLRPVSIERSASLGRWVFATGLSQGTQGAHVVMLDWGSLTSSTILQFLHLARLSNAKSFLALILLSQMEEQAEAPMRAISHLECLTPQPAGAPDAMVGHADVNLPLLSKLKKASGASAPLLHSPVSIRFISALRTGFYHPGDCPACGENSYYKDMAESAPTELLRQYAELRVQELSPSSRDVVMKRKCQFDLFGEPLSTRDIARCLQVRRLLEGSIRSTRLRFEVLEQLREIAGKPEMELAIPWFRLLSSEHTWTRLPPLAYDRTRKYLADICEEALLSTDTVSPGIRRQAAVVMRNVAPDTLSRQFGKLLQRNLNSRDVTGELLMSMVRILGNPRRFEDESVVDLDEGLRTMTDDILQGSLRAPMAENSYPTLSVISEALRQRRPLDREAQESRLEAWRALWACYAGPIKMHNLLARDVALGVAMALDAPSEPPGLPTSESWNHALSSWEQCRAFLYEEVIPHLRRLSSVLLNPLLQDRLLDQYRERLHRILRGPLEPAQGELTELLWKFRQDPNRFGDPLLRDRARNEWTFWYKSFFAPDPAAVLQAIQRCPADLWDLLHSSLAHVKQQSNLRRIGNCQGIENPALAAKVYCDKTLLLSALQQVLENALDPKHVDSECDVSEAVDIFIDCPESETNSSNEVVFRIWNTGTRPTEPSGNGLDKAAERLALFEGTLIPKAVYEQSEELPEGVPDAVTYMVTFRINKWENHD